MPRRAATRRSGNAGSAASFALLVGLLVLVGAGVLWVLDPFAVLSAIGAGLPRSSTSAGSTAAGASAGSAAPALLPVAEVAASGATPTPGRAGVSPTPLPTLRQWDTSGGGVIVDAALVGRLDQALAGVDGHVSVAVKDLASGRGAVLDGDRELPAASLYKLPILFAVFEAGLSLAEELPITDEARAYDSGTLELGVGESLSVAEALERMVTISDNTAAVMLGGRAGGGRVNADIGALGMDATHYSLERMTTSASDMLHFLDLLGHGRLVSASASADMIHLLLRQRVNDRLPRLLPNGVEVAHKTGNLPGTVNDVGIMYGPSSTIAVAALVADTTDEPAAASAIAHLALAAYTYFEEQPEDTSRPMLPRAPARPVPPVWRVPRPVPTATPTDDPEEPTLTPAVEAIHTPAGSTPAPPAVPATTATPALGPTVRSTPAPPAPSPTAAPAQPTSTPVPAATRTALRATASATPVVPAKR